MWVFSVLNTLIVITDINETKDTFSESTDQEFLRSTVTLISVLLPGFIIYVGGGCLFGVSVFHVPDTYS